MPELTDKIKKLDLDDLVDRPDWAEDMNQIMIVSVKNDGTLIFTLLKNRYGPRRSFTASNMAEGIDKFRDIIIRPGTF